MHRRAAAVLFALVLAFAFTACSDDDEPNASDATTSTTPVTVATTSTAVTAPAGPVTSPEAAAKGLFRAWQRTDRNDASRYARQRAIDNLFEHPYSVGGDNATYTDQGCAPQGGQFICSWTYEGGAMQMTVEHVSGNSGYVVDNVTYIAD